MAIAWLLGQPGVTAPILGARTLAQLEDNLGALDVVLTADQRERLDTTSRPDSIFPGRFLARPMVRQLIFGSSQVRVAG